MDDHQFLLTQKLDKWKISRYIIISNVDIMTKWVKTSKFRKL